MKKLILLIFVVAASLNAQRVQGQIGQVPVVAAADNSPVGGAGNLTTVGSVPYVSASGILNQDAGQFFWDATNNRLGIGTNAPSTFLHVSDTTNTPAIIARFQNTSVSGGPILQLDRPSDTRVTALQYSTAGVAEWTVGIFRDGGSSIKTYMINLGNDYTLGAASKLVIDTAGNVGIGTTAPGNKLTVVGSGAVIRTTGTNDTSAVYSQFNSSASTGLGYAGVEGSTPGATLTGTLAYATFISAGSSGSALQLGTPGGIRATILASGNVGIGTTAPTYLLDVAKSGASGTARFYDQTATTGSTFAVFRAGVAQSGNVLEVQNNAGSNVLSVTSTGALTSNVSIVAGGNISAGATQDVGWSTRSTMTSPAGGIITLYNNAQTDFTRLQFGGTTSSFPSIKRNGTALVIRLADDSANAAFQASSYISNDGTAGVTVTTCTGFKNGLCISGM